MGTLFQEVSSCLKRSGTAVLLGDIAKKVFIRTSGNKHNVKDLDALLTIYLPLLTCLESKKRRERQDLFVERYLAIKNDSKPKSKHAVECFDEFFFGVFMTLMRALNERGIVIQNLNKKGRVTLKKLDSTHHYVYLKVEEFKEKAFFDELKELKSERMDQLNSVLQPTLENIIDLFKELGLENKLLEIRALGQFFHERRVTSYTGIELRVLTTENVYETLSEPLNNALNKIFVNTGVTVDALVSSVDLKDKPQDIWKSIGGGKRVHVNPSYRILLRDDAVVDNVLNVFTDANALRSLKAIVLKGPRKRKGIGHGRMQIVRIIAHGIVEDAVRSGLDNLSEQLIELTGTKFEFILTNPADINHYEEFYPHNLKRFFNGKLLYAKSKYSEKVLYLVDKYKFLKVTNLRGFRTK